MGKHLHKFNTYSDMEDYVLSSGFTVPFVGSCPESSGSSSNTICGYNIEASGVIETYNHFIINDIIYGFNLNVSVGFGKYAQGPAIYILEGVSHSLPLVNGCGFLSYSGLCAGNYTIEFESPVQDDARFEVCKLKPTLTVEVDDITYPHKAMAVINCNGEYSDWEGVPDKETVEIILDGNLVYGSIYDYSTYQTIYGYESAEEMVLDGSFYSISALSGSGTTHFSSYDTSDYQSIVVNGKTYYYIDYTESHNNDRIEPNMVSWKTPENEANNLAMIDIYGLQVGEHTLEVLYLGDGNYGSVLVTKTFMVSPQ